MDLFARMTNIKGIDQTKEIDNIHFNRYLKIVAQKELDFFVSLEEAFFANDEREENTRK